jgi:hypothetical protein
MQSEMLRDRFSLMKQRVLRDDTFAPPTVQRGPNRYTNAAHLNLLADGFGCGATERNIMN